MNKFFIMGAALTMAVAFTSCKSNESAYKKAYDKALAAQANTENYGQQTTPTNVTPVVTTPQNTATQQVTPVQTTPDYSNVSVRTENVTVVAGGNIKAYSVVVGSFSVQANALGLQSKLNNSGYSARVVKAQVNGSDWYRVIAGTFDSKNEAASFRAAQQGTYPDAWLLYAK